jgi:hypothetical protein
MVEELRARMEQLMQHSRQAARGAEAEAGSAGAGGVGADLAAEVAAHMCGRAEAEQVRNLGPRLTGQPQSA